MYIDDIEDELEEPEDLFITENKEMTDGQEAEKETQKPTLISIFVDKTKTARTVQNTNDQQKMQGVINRVGDWSVRWDLQFNVDKRKVSHAGRINQRFEYYLYGKTLQSTEAEKDVGVILTHDLRPSKMVAKAASRANQVLGAWARAV